jgi:vacuolar protein sorting-associated protein 13A/C
LQSRGIFSAIGSLDVLGNPEGALSNLRGGFEDLFYEPAKAVVHRPSSFGRAVAFGAESFSRSVVGSVTGVASKITGALGSGLAVLTMDKSYQQARQRIHRGHNFGDGVKAGVESFALGLKKGVTGLWEQPMEGARESGGLGVVTGIGKGLLGLVTKPVGGAVDLISSSLGGVEASASGIKEAERIRQPRHVGLNGIITFFFVFLSFHLCLRLCRRAGRTLCGISRRSLRTCCTWRMWRRPLTRCTGRPRL